MTGGVNPKVAQTLARHSVITLTMDRYTDVGLFDLSASVNSLPGVPVDVPSAPVTWGGTGTDVQHAVFQLLHQGTTVVPVEFVVVREGDDRQDPEHHSQLLLNAFAQGAASPEVLKELAPTGKLRAGNYGWGHAKQELYEVLEARLAPLRERYLELRRQPARVDAVLEEGAAKARVIARRTLGRVRRAVGID